MKLPTNQQRREFAAYLHGLTDAQLKQVYVEKVDERQIIFAALVENEVEERGKR